MFRSFGAAALAVLTGLTVAVPAASSEAGPGAVQQGLNSLVREHDFPAAMASVREPNGRGRFYSAGVGDVRTGEPVPVDGQVRIASNTKMFTSTVVLQLVGEGKIGLDEPIETYVPGLVRGEGIDGRDITVRQLLQHTSGLPEYFTVDYKDVQHRYVEPRELVDRALAMPAVFAPGTSWRYSNTNYVLVGLIVQRVTGRPVGEEITRRIVEPLGLRHTYWPGVGEQTIREKHAHGYYTPSTSDGRRFDLTELDPSWGWAAGQMIATPGDLNRFLAALVGGRLLAPAQLAEMRRTVAAPGFPPNLRYGLGLMRIELSCGEVAWGHGGDIDGYETRDAITEDGRAATVAVTALPTPEQAPRLLADAVLDTALCQ
ncbi:serine hydrolase domain-containing protein [Actinophytocola sp.]|uniref:serine hydrolase domain-containing protein n=1 Tax=Actinophytocola sp. TaxID=1872138 RepID=UPI002D495292|nr:serine hydrolase domain-containing protein [Actinophytocola sp.]HYQ64429.1 serine hydrolase domain-containing protein [Actinophytocola sp.]